MDEIASGMSAYSAGQPQEPGDPPDHGGGERQPPGAETMTAKAETLAEEQKQRGADRIGGLARVVHGAAQELEPELPQAAAYIHDAASGLERASTSLRERSVEEVIGELGRLAREQPAVLFGGAVLAGIALSRFLKSSRDAAQR